MDTSAKVAGMLGGVWGKLADRQVQGVGGCRGRPVFVVADIKGANWNLEEPWEGMLEQLELGVVGLVVTVCMLA